MARTSEFSDNFNRSNETLETSSNWNKISGGMSIVSNQVVPDTDSVVAEYLTSTLLSSADCYGEYTAVGIPTGVDGHGIILRANASLTSGYLLFFRENDSDILVFRNDSGWVLLGTLATGISYSNGDVFGMEVTGTGATVTIEGFINDVSKGTHNDTHANRDVIAGYSGIRGYRTTEIYDDFETGILGDELEISVSDSVTVSESVGMERGSIVIIEDGFSGTNGDNITGRTPDTINTPGNTWDDLGFEGGGTTDSGEIQSNQASIVNNLSGVAIESGESDVIVSMDFNPAVGSANRNAIVFRQSDADHYWYFRAREDNTDVTLNEYDDGNVVIQTVSVSMTEGNTYVLKVVLNGTSIKCYVDDVLKITHTASFNQTATIYGIVRFTGSDATRLDNFTVESLGDPPPGALTISVSDSTTVSESVSASIYTPSSLNVSVSDSVTVTESVGISIEQPTILIDKSGGTFSNNYTYRRTISVDNTKVSGSSNHTDFRFLFKETNINFAVTGSGGKLENANAYDFAFYSDASGATQLDHEITRHVTTTGEVVAWVRIPSLSYDSDTDIYLFYSDSGISSSQEDVAGTWTGYDQVLHLNESSGSLVNSVDNDTYTQVGTPTYSQTGQIDDAVDYDGSADAHKNQANAKGAATTAFTFSAWINTASIKASPLGTFAQVAVTDTSNDFYFAYRHYDSGGSTHSLKYVLVGTPAHAIFDVTTGLSTGNWMYISGTWTTSDDIARCLVDGTQQGTYDWSGNSPSTGNDANAVGAYQAGWDSSLSQWYDGEIGEMRFMWNTALSNDHIQTEYNNQDSPSTFYTLGSATEAGAGGENVTVTESVNLDINFGDTLQISASDSVTVTESAIPSIQEPAFEVSVSDTTTVSESVNLEEPYFTNIEVSVQEVGSFSNGYSAKRTITIDSSVQDNLTAINLSFLLKDTYSYLADTNNGGLVTSADGHDILFTSDEAGLTELDKDTVFYDNTTGEVQIFVRIPSVSSSVDTVFYMWYGNGTVTTDQDNASGVWQDYHAVYHLTEQGDGTAGEYKDSTGNGYNATGGSGKVPTRGTGSGYFKYYQDFTDHYIDIPQLGAMTGWVLTAYTNPDTLADTQFTFGTEEVTPTYTNNGYLGYGQYVADKTKIAGVVESSSSRVTLNSISVSTGNWNEQVLRYASDADTGTSGISHIINQLNITTSTLSGANITNVDKWQIGNNPANNTQHFDGKIAECRVAKRDAPNGARNAQYKAEFQIVSDFGTFVTIGSETRGDTVLVIDTPNVVVQALSSYVSVSDSLTVTDTLIDVYVNPPELHISVSDTSTVTDAPTLDEPRFSTLLVQTAEPSYSNGYTYRRTITIDRTKINSSNPDYISDLTMLFIGTYDYLSHKNFGGELHNSNGYDLIFTDTSDVQLDHYLEKYNTSTGEVQIYVHLTDVNGNNTTEDTTFYMYYGKSGATDPQVYSDTWTLEGAYTDDKYSYATHFENDVLVERARGLTTSTSGITYAPGKVNDAMWFDGVSDYAEIQHHASLFQNNFIFISGWFYFDSDTQGTGVSVVSKFDKDNQRGWIFGKNSSDQLFWYRTYLLEEPTNTIEQYTSGYTVPFDTWVHIFVSNASFSSAPGFYVNGSRHNSTPDIGYSIHIQNTYETRLGGDYYGTYDNFKGGIDEFKMFSDDISSDISLQILYSADYNNQNSPSTFYSIDGIAGVPVTELYSLSGFERNITPTESVTVTDTPSVFVELPTPTISESETITVTEQIDIFFGALFPTIVASDSTVLIESWWIEFSNPNTLVTDTVTLSEDVSLSIFVPPHLVVVSDTVNVTDTPLVQPPNVTIPVQEDTATVSEFVDLQRFYYFTTQDSATVTDSVALTMDDIEVVAGEGITVIEGIGGATAIDLTADDSVTVSEAVEALIPINLVASELVTVSENVGFTQVMYLSQSEIITVSEFIEFNRNSVFAVSDSLTVTDSINIENLAIEFAVEEPVLVIESLTTIVREPPDFVIDEEEIVTVTEGEISVAVLQPGALGITVGDVVAVTENHQVVMVFPDIHVSDSVTVVDIPSAVTPTVLFVNTFDNLIVNDIFLPSYVDILIPPEVHFLSVYDVTIVTEDWIVDRDIWGDRPPEEDGEWVEQDEPTTEYKEVPDPETDWRDADSHEK